MRNTTSVALALVGLVLYLALASAETRIEVDENGDEYELKRFYIQGRQLSGEGSKGQCVVTRRKRASRSLGLPSNVAVSSQQLKISALPVAETDSIGVEHREALIQLSDLDQSNHRYVTVKLADNNEDAEDDDDEDDDANDEDEAQDDDEEEDEDDDDEVPSDVAKAQSYVPAALALPLSQTSASAAHLPQGVSVVANGAAQANVVAGDAGIVVVQSHQPPKVNPDTHAVFELKPVRQAELQSNVPAYPYPFIPDWIAEGDDGDNGDEDDDYDEDYYYQRGDLLGPLGEYDAEIFSEENPISTEAIWSTDGGEEDLPANNQRPIRTKQKKKKQQQQLKNKRKQNQKEKQKRRRPQQNKRKQDDNKKEDPAMNQDEMEPDQEQPMKKKKQQQQQEIEISQNKDEIKPAKKPASASSVSMSSSSSISSSSVEPSKKPKKPRPSNSSSISSSSSTTPSKRKPKPQQQKKKRKSRPSSSSVNKRRRRPSSSSISSSSSSRPIGGYRRRRPSYQSTQQKQQQQRRRRQKQRKQQEKRRREQQRRRRLRQQNNRNRQFYGNEPIINCIYINKDSPATTTTTQRPFWNILGRDAGPNQGQIDPVAQQAALQAVRRNGGDFGHRKRTNLRFVA